MIREAPDYNYTTPPHDRPPKLLYENMFSDKNITLSFDGFEKAIFP
jgi:hypothetical protein